MCSNWLLPAKSIAASRLGLWRKSTKSSTTFARQESRVGWWSHDRGDPARVAGDSAVVGAVGAKKEVAAPAGRQFGKGSPSAHPPRRVCSGQDFLIGNLGAEGGSWSLDWR